MRVVLLASLTALLLAAGLLAVVVAAFPGETDREWFRGNAALPGLTMPRFALRDQNGRVVRSADLAGKVVVLTFLDTKCTEACPIIARQISDAWRRLTPGERRRTTAVAISTDPTDDTRPNVRAFLTRHRADGSIRYLVGPVDVMRRVWQRFQILSSLESGAADIHSAPVRIYGTGLVWLATQHAGADLSPRNLVHDIRVALAHDSP